MVVQQKTGRPVQFELMADARASLLAWLEHRCGTGDDFAFPSRVDHAGHLSTRQYARLVDEWVSAVGLRREDYGTTRFVVPRPPSSIRPPGISEQFKFCSATPRLRTPSGISASTSRMHRRWPRELKSESGRPRVGRAGSSSLRVRSSGFAPQLGRSSAAAWFLKPAIRRVQFDTRPSGALYYSRVALRLVGTAWPHNFVEE